MASLGELPTHSHLLLLQLPAALASSALDLVFFAAKAWYEVACFFSCLNGKLYCLHSNSRFFGSLYYNKKEWSV